MSTPEQRELIEAQVKTLHQEGQLQEAAAVAVRGYGPEILGFLMALMRDEQDACDVFSQFSEDLWRGLEGFRWQSSFRTWAYTLARNASHRFRRTHGRARQRQVPLENDKIVHDVAHEVRSATLPFLRTEVKDRFASLRDTLTADDQTLLILRIDRKMSWREIVEVMNPEMDDAQMKARAAMLRKRFERLKMKLKEIAEREGLLGDEPG